MKKFYDSLLDQYGNVVSGASVTVYNYGTTTKASLYSDSAGSVSISNPVTTNTNGYFEFYAANGHYSLSISGTNFTAKQVTDILIQDINDVGAWTGVFTGATRTIPVSVTYATTTTIDATLSNVFYVSTLTGNTTLAITGGADGQTINIRFVQDGTGSRTVTLPANVTANGSISSTATYVTWLILTYVSSASRWEGSYATAPAKPTVTGSKGANAALTSLMSALSTLGIVTDSTT